MTPFRPRISAVLPAYNEEANLAATVRELAPILERLACAFEIIVVDDGSTDRTAEVAADLAGSVGPVRVLRHAANRGYGAALRTGFAAARLDWILLLDADGQFAPADLAALLAVAPDADLVVGYRRRRADPPHRRWLAAAWRLVTGALLRLRVRDINCAFKLMRAGVVQALPLESDGAFISAELLARAQRGGARMVQVPVSHRPRLHGRQTGGGVRVLLRAVGDLVRLRRRIEGQEAVPVVRENGELPGETGSS